MSPTPKYNPFRTRVDLFKLIRQLKLRSFFGGSTNVYAKMFKPKSTFTPNVSVHSIQTFEKVVMRDIKMTESKRFKYKFNLSMQEKEALVKLANDGEIIIKQADKGGSIVILDRKDYEFEVLRQLNDATAYVKLSGDPTKSFLNSLKVTIREGLALDYISKELSDFLINEYPRVRVFYVLPKVHKPGFPPLGHPIVTAQGSLHEPVSQYIDSILQPFVHKFSTYLKDATDFIKKIEGSSVPEEALLLSFDVVSLYTNIPHEELRAILQNIFDSRTIPSPTTHFLLNLVDVLMETNYFRYNRDYYVQIKGVAMGSVFAPSAASLFMNDFEQPFILDLSVNPFFRFINKFYCFIDDIFCVYTDPQSLENFLNCLNSLHPSIRFTMSGNKQSVNYLDTKVYKTSQNTLAVCPFKKATDKNTFLHYSSFHSRALRNNIPYGQFLRIK